MYGRTKLFLTNAGTIAAESRHEAANEVIARTGEKPALLRGPKETPSLRSLGIRSIVRHMNRSLAL